VRVSRDAVYLFGAVPQALHVASAAGDFLFSFYLLYYIIIVHAVPQALHVGDCSNDSSSNDCSNDSSNASSNDMLCHRPYM
jgi:hypothetical protein